jgi:(p)ppGpp synthase/HD superfamily hydrolase
MHKNEVEQIETATKWMMDKISQLQRKGHVNWHTIPYFYHCVQVSNLVFKFGAGTVNNQLASLCHDVKEENFSVTHEELVSATNEEAAAIVEELTFYQDRMSKEEYMASFATKSIDAVIIKIADRLCNVMDFQLINPDYALKYMNKAKVLFETFEDRRVEIENKYSRGTYLRIDVAISELYTVVERYEGFSKLTLN